MTMFTIASKELKLLFVSSLVWVFLAVMQLVLAWVFLGRLNTFLEIQPQLAQLANPPGITEVIVAPVFSIASIVLLAVTPVLSMRLFAEERRNHTLVMLISAPVSIPAIVLGKFLALMIFFCLMPLLIVMLSISLLTGGMLDFGLLGSNVIGLILLASCFASLGLYISSLTSYPAIAALGSLGVLLCLWVMDIVTIESESAVRHFSLFRHFENFNIGLIDTFSLAFLLLFAITFLVLTIYHLDGERLNG
ncbi:MULTISPECIES: ABC transporter permease [Nitrosomonas]|uniref:ABC-2 type transport system permease protein n=2 Tax=Nitrosomonas eutropha TaxID=916 RepID=A0ABX5M676_9PROT|nr:MULTISPECIES: ABC transporter permease subunit [Nitrosomonas]ABI60714.1 putative ABC-2 type transport system permease protein [Nitrosomonas eutropha C91]MXS80157.1 ABC transporter permease [Nitrosomonas sp. GH22]PXV79433.1 ABC-2 type transport system permease protein [Nitrosomonas eutropha]SDW07691.1 ABC-2 type transport system permease protein [Nitrosomonas eutropha]SEI48242.1 ABC-2 type transport system permease protein [Nitrosomonas eutropha]